MLNNKNVRGKAYTKGEILGGEDTAEMLLLVDDEYAVCAFGGAELGSVGYGNVVRHGEGGEGSEGGDGALLGSGSGALVLLLLLLLSLRLRAFAREFRFNLLADGLSFVPAQLVRRVQRGMENDHLVTAGLSFARLGEIPLGESG